MTKPLMSGLPLFVLLSPFLGAAQDDAAPPFAFPATCQLMLALDEHGSAKATLSLLLPKPANLPPKKLEGVFADLLAIPVSEVRPGPGAVMIKNQVTLVATAEYLFPTHEGRIEGELDLAPLARLVQPLGVGHVDVYVTETGSRSGPSNLRVGHQHFRVPTDDPQPISFVLGARPGAWSWRAVVLAGLVVVPFAVVLWNRRSALRADDSALAWYRFWRWTHWVTIATWIAWLTLVPALDLHALFHGVSSGVVANTMVVLPAVQLLPPWLITAACAALAQDVFVRLSKAPPPPGTLFRRMAWSVLTLLLPLLLALIGLLTFADGGPRAGALWLAAALAVRLLASRLATRGQDLTPYTATQGDLHDRITELARLAGVPLQQVAVVPADKMPEANAFAVLGGTVMFTETLLQRLTRREVDAVAAHELAHLKYRHPGWLLAFFLAVVLLPGVARPVLPHWWHDTWLQHLPIGLLLGLAAVFFVMRRFEFQVDSYAAWLTGDPEAMITGLLKIHKLSLLPMRWGKWEEGLLTHPSTSTRLEAIARENGISRRRLEEIVQTPDQPGEHYALPERPAAEIFSTEFRQKTVNRIGWLLLAGALVPPTLVALAVWWSGVGGNLRWAMLAGGVALTVAVSMALQNLLPLWGYAYVRRRLTEKLAGEGIDVGAPGGTFVSFAPDAEPRLYENFTNWDFGFLILLGDRLCYVGEHARFVVRRDQVTDIHLGPGMPRLLAVPYVYVDWYDAASGTKGTFSLRSGEVRSMRELGRANRALDVTLRRWQGQPDAPAEVAAPLAELSPPAIGDVASLPIASLVRPGAWAFQIGFIFALGLGLAFLLGLPFDAPRGGLAWFGPIVACAVVCVEMLPLLLSRRGTTVSPNP